jgi:hypothetical protein
MDLLEGRRAPVVSGLVYVLAREAAYRARIALR